MAYKKEALAWMGVFMCGLILFPYHVMAADTVQPTTGLVPEAVYPNQNSAAPMSQEAYHSTIPQGVMDTFGLRVIYLRADGKLDVYGKTYPILSSGVRIEMLRNFELIAVPGVDFGTSVSFVNLVGENQVQADINGDPDLEYNVPWKVNPVLNACIAMLKCRYGFDMGMARIGLGVGVGLGYFYQELLWEYKDPEDETIILDGWIEREDVFKPCVDWNIQLDFRLNECHRVGLVFSALTVPVFIRAQSSALVSGMRVRTDDSIALYKNNVVLGLGVNWEVRF